MTSNSKPELVTVRYDDVDYPGLVAYWDNEMVITEDFELITPQRIVPRILDGNTDSLMHLSEGMPVTYNGPEQIGIIPAHISKLIDNSITIRDARSPFTVFENVSLESLTYRMNFLTQLPSGKILECTIDTLHIIAKHYGLKIVTNPPHLSYCPPRYWIVPYTSNDCSSKVIRAFEPGKLWINKRRKTNTQRISNKRRHKRNYSITEIEKNNDCDLTPSVDITNLNTPNYDYKTYEENWFDLNDSDDD